MRRLPEGGSATYTLRLNTQPSDDVTVTVASDNADVTPEPASLTFTAQNWNRAQRVTVRAGRDDDAADDAATLTHAAASDDAAYDGAAVAIPDVAVTVADDGMAGIALGTLDPSPVPENGTAAYTVALDTQPTEDVVVDVTSDNTDVTVQPASLTFTRQNWNAPRTVTVTAAQEDDDSADDRAVLTHAVRDADSADEYDGLTAELRLTVTDNDVPGLSLSALSPSQVPEGGSATYSVSLNVGPSADVTVVIVSDNRDVTAAPGQLVFTPQNWNQPRTVTVSAAHDGDTADDTASLIHAIPTAGSAAEYRRTDMSLPVTVADDDTVASRSIRLSPSRVSEGDGTVEIAVTVDLGERHNQYYAVWAEFSNTSSGAFQREGWVPRGETWDFSGGHLPDGRGPSTRFSTGPDGVFTHRLRLTLNDDTKTEGDETVVVRFAMSTTPNGQLTFNETRQAILTIEDNDEAPQAQQAPPAVSGLPSVSGPGSGGAYAAGERIEARVAFTEPVTVDTSDGTPTLGLVFGGARLDAVYEGGSGTGTLVFALAAPEAAPGPARAIANGIRLHGATVRDANGADAVLAFGAAPGVASLAIGDPPGGDGAWSAGETVAVTVTFAEPVVVDTANGTPTVGLELGDGAGRKAAWTGGSGTAALTFAYTITADDPPFTSVTVPPNTLALNGGAIRSTAGLAASLGHHGAALAGAPPPPAREPTFDVADASAQEGPGAVLAFRVTLTPPSPGVASVYWETLDGTAKVFAPDYSGGTGQLVFQPGETEKTVAVRVVDDDIDEGTETMTLRLSHPSGAVLGDAEATGTIVNADLMPRAWLARFGRTVADQAIDAVTARLETAPTPGSEVRIGGQAVGGEVSPEAQAACETRQAARWFRFEDGTGAGEDGNRVAAGTGGLEDRCRSETRGMTERELLTGSSFRFTGGSAETGFGTVWGSAAVTGFDGRESELSLDGEVLSATVGADFARERTTLGLALAHSQGDGSYSGAGSGKVESTLTGLYPYGRYAVSDRFSLWGVAGYGAGTLTLTPGAGARVETDIDMQMAAAGLRGVLAEAPAGGGVELAAKSDGLMLQISSDSARDVAGGRLAAANANVTRLRLGLEGTWRGIETGGGGTLLPALEVGLRQDGGDAETGLGLEAGAGIAWTDPQSGIQMEFNASGLLAHEDGGFRERGVSGSFAWDPASGSDRGPSLSLTQTLGDSATYSADSLFADGVPADLAANDDGGLDARRFEAKLGYGLGAFGDRFTMTPELGFGLSNDSRDLGLGWRLNPSGGDRSSFELRLDATRREPANDAAEPEHGLQLRFNARW